MATSTVGQSYTHTSALCSPTSVGLAQVRPNYRSVSPEGCVLWFLAYCLNKLPFYFIRHNHLKIHLEIPLLIIHNTSLITSRESFSKFQVDDENNAHSPHCHFYLASYLVLDGNGAQNSDGDENSDGAQNSNGWPISCGCFPEGLSTTLPRTEE